MMIGALPQPKDNSTIYIRLEEPDGVITMVQCLSEFLEIPMRLHYQ